LPFAWNKLLTVNYSDFHLGQAVFTRDGQHWRVELVDWEDARVVEGWSHPLRQNPKKAFSIPKNSDIYIPPFEKFEELERSFIVK
jgi:hypothetical protein